MFGAGGGTSSYREVEDTDLIVLWGSNARETHPIFFHHLLKGVRKGARLYAVDPRRTSSAEWADGWLGLDVGSDIALANAMAREIIHAGLENREFIERATVDFDAYKAKVESYTLDYAEGETGVPAEAIRDLAHAFATAPRAMICWTLGITEHHNAVDNVLALISLVLLTGHVGRYGSGVNPLRGQNNVQGGGDMGALPDRLPGFQHVENDELRAKFDAEWGVAVPPSARLAPVRHVRRDGARRPDRGLLHRREPGPVRGRPEARDPSPRGSRPARRPGPVPDQDRRAGRRRPAGDRGVGRDRRGRSPTPNVASSACARRSNRRRVRATTSRSSSSWPTGWARAGARPDAEAVWDEVRRLSPVHAGMSYRRLEELGGLQWPCYDETHPGELFLHSRLWEDPVPGNRVPFVPVDHDPPVDRLTDDYPIRLTTGRRLDSYNTGVQTSGYTSPLRRGESLDISPEDAATYALADGETVRVVSRRGQVEVPIRIDPSLRPGLTFMTLHFQDDVAVNLLTIDATDPKSGTAEFKATAIRIERLEAAEPASV